MEGYPYFPAFINLSDKKLVVIGAGRIASRRIRTLLQFTGSLTVIAPSVHPQIERLAQEGSVRLLCREYEAADLDGADMVFAATDDTKVNRRIWEICRKRKIPVNVCDDREKCDFYFPGIARGKGVVIGVSASGQDHAQAKRVTERIRDILKEDGEA